MIIGSNAYAPIVDQHRLPRVIGGFEEFLMAEALAALAEQIVTGEPALVNLYPEAVSAAGNTVAQRLLDEVFKPASVRWRGLGVIPDSGLVLRDALAPFDAERKYGLVKPNDLEPKGCICGDVIADRAAPDQCSLFARGCTPISPIGPCMVSSEGTCQAWFKYRRAGSTGPKGVF
ncbi:MAG: hypothetical protein GC164_02885 [Phycisphaera sp.]|nr:hypothetical protein [Phycisphaera sp.]